MCSLFFGEINEQASLILLSYRTSDLPPTKFSYRALPSVKPEVQRSADLWPRLPSTRESRVDAPSWGAPLDRFSSFSCDATLALGRFNSASAATNQATTRTVTNTFPAFPETFQQIERNFY